MSTIVKSDRTQNKICRFSYLPSVFSLMRRLLFSFCVEFLLKSILPILNPPITNTNFSYKQTLIIKQHGLFRIIRPIYFCVHFRHKRDPLTSKMSRAIWKYCFVLSCTNNSKKNPDKYYFRVPYNREMRDKWCIAVDRSASSIKQSSTAYCCTDHFDVCLIIFLLYTECSNLLFYFDL